MDNARKKLRVCLICVVMAAVIVGFIYYINDVRTHNTMSEGTLVRDYMSVGESCSAVFFEAKDDNCQGVDSNHCGTAANAGALERRG